MGPAFIERALLWIVLLPLLGALINGIAGRRADKSLVTGVAVGSVFGAFLLALVCFGYLLSTGGDAVVQNTVYTWFSITVHGAEVPIHVRFLMDHLSGIMTVMVTGIGALIHVYSVGYMGEDPGYARFMTYLNLFMASMLILVLGSSLPLMFVGWEGVGLCSYLLIGFWYENADYAAAGRKAFVVNRIGDFGVLMGMFLLVWAVVPAGHGPGAVVEAFDFQAINAAAPALGNRPFNIGTFQLDTSIATLAVLFLFLGCAGKSAQIPLYVWLPDAMAGPTPVSALIHAATMVTAGVYLMVRLSPLVVQSPYAMSFIAIVGALTALLAASIALVQNQMKKILAYSTVSQLGFMFAAVGMGAFAGGVFHVFTHAFFKACLFLGAGSVMHAVHAHGDADIRWLGGLKKWLPKTHVTFAIATAAIAGLPLLSGFFSKDEIPPRRRDLGSHEPLRRVGGLARLRHAHRRRDDDGLLHVPALLPHLPRRVQGRARAARPARRARARRARRARARRGARRPPRARAARVARLDDGAAHRPGRGRGARGLPRPAARVPRAELVEQLAHAAVRGLRRRAPRERGRGSRRADRGGDRRRAQRGAGLARGHPAVPLGGPEPERAAARAPAHVGALAGHGPRHARGPARALPRLLHLPAAAGRARGRDEGEGRGPPQVLDEQVVRGRALRRHGGRGEQVAGGLRGQLRSRGGRRPAGQGHRRAREGERLPPHAHADGSRLRLRRDVRGGPRRPALVVHLPAPGPAGGGGRDARQHHLERGPRHRPGVPLGLGVGRRVGHRVVARRARHPLLRGRAEPLRPRGDPRLPRGDGALPLGGAHRGPRSRPRSCSSRAAIR
ncbi:MAG: NADH-quinone oxidoreductase subunit L [Sandaracinaceae bacterium]|nr:NADH-quinone oxidoreductase subunit L [Sandaracinaceae bacterium]